MSETNVDFEKLKEFAEQWNKDKSHQEVCPNCGYCPHCGRDRQLMPLYPSYPYYSSPWWPHITWTVTGGGSPSGNYM